MNFPPATSLAAGSLLPLALFLGCFAPSARADEEKRPPKVLRRVKAATVYVRAQFGPYTTRGSGFLMRRERDGTTGYIVTNNHVVNPTTLVVPGPPGPGGAATRRLIYTPNPRKLSVVFNSGADNERVVGAELVFATPNPDLAILKIKGVKKLPEPIVYDKKLTPEETMGVYVLGFPFGDKLAAGKGNPAITIHEGKVSSLRLDARKKLAFVQVEAEVHPGNSGGPVVDSKGRLVGVIVQKVNNTRIGLAIAARQLGEVLAGHHFNLSYRLWFKEKALDMALLVTLFDPDRQLGSLTLHYIPRAALKGKPVPLDRNLGDLPGGKKVPLKIGPASAQGLFTIAPMPGTVVLQLVRTSKKGGRAFRTGPIERTIVMPVPPPAPKELSAVELKEALTDLRSPAVIKARAAAARLRGAKPLASQRKQAVEALRAQRGHRDLRARADVLGALGQWDGKDSLPLLTPLLDDHQPVIVRVAVIDALGKIPDERAAAAVARRLKAREAGAAQTALRMMGKVAEKAARKHLDDREMWVRIEACKALEFVGTRDSLARLEKLARSKDEHLVVRAAQDALKAIRARK
jgi:S1-C subfamily serine protease